MSDPEGRPPEEEGLYRAQNYSERTDKVARTIVKVIGFLVVGTIGLGVLFFGTCVLLMR